MFRIVRVAEASASNRIPQRDTTHSSDAPINCTNSGRALGNLLVAAWFLGDKEQVIVVDTA
jgi:hypothetical protein